ncbi:MAG: aminotransferase class V-fold PLP-dependent enzyme [Granulosicoccus sp.]
MPAMYPDVDPDGLLEYSVVYTDRALNHMSTEFQSVVNDITATLKKTYCAHSAVLVPGSGTYGMEAVARQFANNQRCLVIRNGWFSYRWSQILDAGNIADQVTVLKARQQGEDIDSPWKPVPIEEAVATIDAEKPAVVFAPHVETSAGLMLPDEYISALAKATHDAGGLFVLDCIASGTVWVDMEDTGVDLLISAPQKGWSGPPCAGLVMLSERARKAIDDTNSSSFACDLKKWLQIMETYEAGGHAYHATMPTESLRVFRNVMRETESFGLQTAKDKQLELGRKVRSLLESHGIVSTAAPGFQAPGVVVSYTRADDIHNGKRFAAIGMQIAAGVPLMCDESASFKTFRLGLFGLDKLQNVDRTVASLESALSKVLEPATV